MSIKPSASRAEPAAGISRRDFLQHSALAGGGLVIGITLGGCGEKPVEVVVPDVAKAVPQNAWLTIATDGQITFYCGQSEMGQGVYTALPTILAEELEVPVSDIKVVDAGAGDAYINDLLGTQVTGGSTSIRDAWVKLRAAGAEARMRLVLAAADLWEVSSTECTAANATVTGPDGSTLSYGELTEAAAQIQLVDTPVLKPTNTFRQIGREQIRLDTPDKTTGTAEYGIDVRRPGQVYAAIEMCPVLGGKLKSVDVTEARRIYRVIDVVQLETAVVVIANTWWLANQAREKLKIEWDTSGHDELSTAQIVTGLREAADNRMDEAQVARSDGDVSAAMSEAGKTIAAQYDLPMLAHATMEPMSCTAEFTDDGLHVYTGTQVQQVAQATAAAAAGLEPEQVTIHTTLLGGGFGRRLEVDFIPAAVVAAQKIGRPVQLLWTREDDMRHDYYRPPAHDRMAAAFDTDGKLSAWSFDIVSPSITARWAPAAVENAVDPFAIEAAANFPYAVPNVQVRYLRHEIGIDVGYWRSVSHATNCFAAESFMDELALKAGKDPFEFRQALLQEQPLWRNVLELAAVRAGWGNAPADHYQGIALMEGYNTYMAQVAEISIEGDKLKVHKITCAFDCGQVINPGIVRAQAVSGIVFGLSAALWGRIDIEGGIVQQDNFDTMRILRTNELPQMDIHVVPSDREPGGMGEPSTSLVAPAIANAIAAATGKRLRSLPFSRHGLT